MVSLRPDSLSSRLGALEERVFGVDNHDLIQKQLSRGTDPFYKRMEKLREDAYETFQNSFATFLEKYENSPVYIESPNYVSPSGLTVQEKLELLKAGQEDLSNTFRGLETIARLKDKINDDSAFQNVLKHEERLQKIESTFENIVQRSQNVHQRAGLLTEKYDNVVNNLCEKMIVWNNFFDEKKSDGSGVSSADNEKVSTNNKDAPEPSKALVADYESMKYASLRTLCKQRGINAAGKKVDLIKKLTQADQEGR